MSLWTPLGGSYGFLSQRDVKSQEVKSESADWGPSHSQSPCCRFRDWEDWNHYQPQLWINSLTSLIGYIPVQGFSQLLYITLIQRETANAFRVPPASNPLTEFLYARIDCRPTIMELDRIPGVSSQREPPACFTSTLQSATSQVFPAPPAGPHINLCYFEKPSAEVCWWWMRGWNKGTAARHSTPCRSWHLSRWGKEWLFLLQLTCTRCSA